MVFSIYVNLHQDLTLPSNRPHLTILHLIYHRKIIRQWFIIRQSKLLRLILINNRHIPKRRLHRTSRLNFIVFSYPFFTFPTFG